MKKILITGITGFVGSHLADLLLEKEPEAALYGFRRVNARFRNVRHILDRINWIEGDLIDPTSVESAVKTSSPDEIYHLGALSWVTPSWNMPAAYMQVNAIGTIHLFESVLKQGIKPRILVSCTPEEFGDVDPKNLPITEHSEIAPVNHYAASKVAQDAVCQSYYASYGLKILRTRAFNHEGPRRDVSGALASFAYQIARIERGLQEPIVKVGNLDAKRNFTHVRDMVRAYWLAMQKCVPGQLYLIGSDNVCTIKECLESLILLSTVEGIKYEVSSARVRPTELKYLIGDCSKFRNLTGWKPEIPFEDTLKDILNYWRDFLGKGLY
jgi:GDP-4-dehydro-6-deoxy-D-mannose reductase